MNNLKNDGISYEKGGAEMRNISSVEPLLELNAPAPIAPPITDKADAIPAVTSSQVNEDKSARKNKSTDNQPTPVTEKAGSKIPIRADIKISKKGLDDIAAGADLPVRKKESIIDTVRTAIEQLTPKDFIKIINEQTAKKVEVRKNRGTTAASISQETVETD